MAFDLDGSARQHGGHPGVLADGGSAAVPARPLAGAQAAEAEQGRSIRLRRKAPHAANYNSSSRQGIILTSVHGLRTHRSSGVPS